MKNKRFINALVIMVVIVLFGTFALGSGESTETNQGSDVAQIESDGTNLGNYNVEILSCRLSKDYEGKDAVIVKYKFKNEADNPISFMVALEDSVYQNGVGLNEAILMDSTYSSDDQMKDIKKGAEIEVEVAYVLNDSETDIEVEVKELISFDDSVVKKTFSIK